MSSRGAKRARDDSLGIAFGKICDDRVSTRVADDTRGWSRGHQRHEILQTYEHDEGFAAPLRPEFLLRPEERFAHALPRLEFGLELAAKVGHRNRRPQLPREAVDVVS